MTMQEFGPRDGELTVHTGRGGAAAKAGHDLEIEVTRWHGTLTLGEQPAIELQADARSLRVREGTGGISPLGDEEKASIAQTIDDEVLKGADIVFRSTSVKIEGRRLEVRGELELLGRRAPVEFPLRLEGDRITGSAMVKQTDFGIKPYSALFGTLKVADVVEVAVDARVPAAVPTVEAERHG
jgi:polyisoprenoid-binding protein YceI